MGALRYREGRGVYFLNYCARNLGGSIEEQISGAFDKMEERLALFGLTLEHVVPINCLFRDAWNIPVMEEIVKKRFHGHYPARKSIQTEFAAPGGQRNGSVLFQVDGIAYRKD